MDKTETNAFVSLCKKLEKMIDSHAEKISQLQEEINALKSKDPVLYSQSQVAAMTGWTKSTIAVWMNTGLIMKVPVPGKKCEAIPASEVDKILRIKGPGKHYPVTI